MAVDQILHQESRCLMLQTLHPIRREFRCLILQILGAQAILKVLEVSDFCVGGIFLETFIFLVYKYILLSRV